MNREVHVRFWESAGVRFLCATHLPARLRDRECGPRRHRPPHQLLQPAPAAPSSSNPGRGVLRIAASALGRSSLTPQDPLTNLRNPFRSTGPALGVANAAVLKGMTIASNIEVRTRCSLWPTSSSRFPF